MESELAWVAGFYDGEGSTTCASSGRDKKYHWIRMQVQQKGVECLLRIQQALGVGRVNPTGRAGMYTLDIAKQTDVGVALRLLWPYMSTPKKWQALRAYQTKYNRSTL